MVIFPLHRRSFGQPKAFFGEFCYWRNCKKLKWEKRKVGWLPREWGGRGGGRKDGAIGKNGKKEERKDRKDCRKDTKWGKMEISRLSEKSLTSFTQVNIFEVIGNWLQTSYRMNWECEEIGESVYRFTFCARKWKEKDVKWWNRYGISLYTQLIQ